MHASFVRSVRRTAGAAFAFLTLALAAAPALQAQADSVRPAPLFTKRELVISGIGAAISVGMMQYDREIRRWVLDSARQGNQGLSDVAEAAGHINEKSLFAANLLTWGVGRLAGNETMADIGLHAAEAVFLTTLATQVIRISVGRSRPFVTNGTDAFDYKPFAGTNTQAYRSFPSIHAASSFATAAVITGETYRRKPGAVKFVAPLTFAVAALPGPGRMYIDKHWASDVALGMVMGTTIGIATVRYHHTRPNNRLDRWMLSASRAPLNDDPAIAMGFTF